MINIRYQRICITLEDVYVRFVYSLFNVQDRALNIMFDIVLRLINHWLTWKTHNIMFTVNHLTEYSGNYALVYSSCWSITEKCPWLIKRETLDGLTWNTCNVEKWESQGQCRDLLDAFSACMWACIINHS